MNNNQKSNTIAAIGTAIFMALMVLLLLWITIAAPVIEEDEGIMVSFGDADTGGGREDGAMAAAAVPELVAPPPAPSAPSNNDLMTQEDEETLALQRQRDEEARQRAEAEMERLRRQREEEARVEAERIAREKALAEQKAKQQQAMDKAAAMGALFGQTGSDEGANGAVGESASSGTKGNPVGRGSAGGNSWNLNGRRLIGDLPHPSNTFTQEGRVVVSIIVDATGKVVSAMVSGNGTTISDETTRQLAVKAALKAKFDMVDRPDKAMGTITYNFKFK